MKILLIVSGRRVNGVMTHCRALARELIERGDQVFIVCRAGSWIANQNIPGVTFVHSEMRRHYFALRRVAKIIRSENIDIVHTHMSRAHFFLFPADVVLRCIRLICR